MLFNAICNSQVSGCDGTKCTTQKEKKSVVQAKQMKLSQKAKP